MGELIDSDKPWRPQYPISTVCPACGSSAHRKVKPTTALAFTDDRICSACSTRYSPPTPLWARVVFGSIGLVLLLCGGALIAAGAALLLGLLKWNTSGVSYLTVGMPLSVAAVACFYLAFRKEVMGSSPVASCGEGDKNTPGPTNPDEPVS